MNDANAERVSACANESLQKGAEGYDPGGVIGESAFSPVARHPIQKCVGKRASKNHNAPCAAWLDELLYRACGAGILKRLRFSIFQGRALNLRTS